MIGYTWYQDARSTENTGIVRSAILLRREVIDSAVCAIAKSFGLIALAIAVDLPHPGTPKVIVYSRNKRFISIPEGSILHNVNIFLIIDPTLKFNIIIVALPAFS